MRDKEAICNVYMLNNRGVQLLWPESGLSWEMSFSPAYILRGKPSSVVGMFAAMRQPSEQAALLQVCFEVFLEVLS